MQRLVESQFLHFLQVSARDCEVEKTRKKTKRFKIKRTHQKKTFSRFLGCFLGGERIFFVL